MTVKSNSIGCENGNGVITAEIPRIQKMLKMFEPKMFPTAISIFLRYTAATEVANSGNDVPTATIVKPINASLTQSALANTTAPSTIHFPPITNPINPTTMRKVERGYESFGTASASALAAEATSFLAIANM